MMNTEKFEVHTKEHVYGYPFNRRKISEFLPEKKQDNIRDHNRKFIAENKIKFLKLLISIVINLLIIGLTCYLIYRGATSNCKKNDAETACLVDSDCPKGFICYKILSNNKCDCPINMYNDSMTNSCKNKSSNGGICDEDRMCREDQGLNCLGGICSCNSSKQFWSAISSSCRNYLIYSEIGCTLDSECMPGISLFCIKNTTTNVCSCLPNMYYDSMTNSCKNKSSNGEICNGDRMCRDDQGLYCWGGICSCISSQQFWSASSNICKNYYNYSEFGCKLDSECMPGLSLFCNTNPTTNPCNCPSISQTNMCDCRRTNGNEYYWDGSKCASALVYDKVCKADYECQTITKGLACNSTFGRCYCMKGWDYYGGKCYKIFSKNGGCSSSCDENDIIPKCPSEYSRSQLAIISNSGIFNFIKSLDTTLVKTNFKDSYIGGYYKNSGCCARFFGFCTDNCNWKWCTGYSNCFYEWTWVDGSLMSTSASTGSWCTGSKSGYYNENSNDFCVITDSLSSNCFTNADCSTDRNFICEYSVI